jgi:quinohemoprotein ethanol dehydrogenase
MGNGFWKKAVISLLVVLLVFLTACTTQSTTDKPKESQATVAPTTAMKPTETPKESQVPKVETTNPDEGKTAVSSGGGPSKVAPIIKQQKDFLGKVAPAFTSQELLALPTDKWATNGGNLYNQRYASLDKINTTNISQLKGQWTAHLGSGLEFKYSGEATPIVYDGVMYVITGADDVLALDAKTGETIWEYRPQLNQQITTVCCGWTSRGVAVGEGKVFVGQLDARLVALDQKTGKVAWETELDKWEKGYTITSAPLYYDGKVYTGISGGEYGIRGRLTAFDAESGKELWRFNTIPGPGEVGHETWPQDNKLWMTGGAPVWQTPAVDPELGLIYFSTGNASPDLDGSQRAGDNLFAASIVAIDAKTGKYKWHFQEVHHDIWDYDAPSPVVLFDVNLGGKQRKALGQPGKTGWVYFLDRTNGKPLIGINEKAVPQEPKQKTSPTQPIPVGDAFVKQTVTQEDIKKDIPNYNGKIGSIFTPFWDDPVVVKPSALGGANWPPSSYNPETGYMYVLGNERYYSLTRSDGKYEEGKRFIGSLFSAVEDAPAKGTLTAIDVKTNKIAWQENWDTTAYSGTLTTKGGLVFAGHNDGRLIAYDAKTGKQLWEFQTGAGVNAPAIAYEIDGAQYISVFAAGNSLAGSKHSDTVWTFSLDGKLEPVK